MFDELFDWIKFYTTSAIFQPCNGGDMFEKEVFEFDMTHNFIRVRLYTLSKRIRKNKLSVLQQLRHKKNNSKAMSTKHCHKVL